MGQSRASSPAATFTLLSAGIRPTARPAALSFLVTALPPRTRGQHAKKPPGRRLKRKSIKSFSALLTEVCFAY
jgi:hypothetical protein